MDAKRLIGACVVLLVTFGLCNVVAQAGGNEDGIRDIRSTETGTFVSTNFDFDHSDLSTPANYVNGEGNSNAGNSAAKQLMSSSSAQTNAPCRVALRTRELNSYWWGPLELPAFVCMETCCFLKPPSRQRAKISPPSPTHLSHLSTSRRGT